MRIRYKLSEAKPYKPPHPNSLRARMHNGLGGSVSMAQQAMDRVLTGDTTTEEAKRTAAQIFLLLQDLRQALKVRVDPPEE